MYAYYLCVHIITKSSRAYHGIRKKVGGPGRGPNQSPSHFSPSSPLLLPLPPLPFEVGPVKSS